MNFEKYLKNTAKIINQELDLILSEFVKQSKKTNLKLLPFAQKFLNANKGGKRIRGVLCRLGYELASSKLENGEIFKVASALEILHTALLIHDDIMDKSLKRRGKTSLYQALGGKHLGISQAICLGDIGFFLPVKIISETSFEDKLKNRALIFLSEVIINTGWGQILDAEGSRKDMEFIRIFKTAKYTVAGPLQIGAILAGANEKLVELLGEFGENLGIAFQIRDDILDSEIKKLDSEPRPGLKYVSLAKQLIPRITNDPKMRKLLEEMGEYLVERKK